MEEQYWVGDFFVDLSRNQLTQKQQSQTLPPKALAVLTCLAKNKASVVSQDELLSHVWPNSVVAPNTLQRCIAQLRKALGDDGKVQRYIKTHAKQGYSLEVDVHWQQPEPNNANKDSSPLPTTLAVQVEDSPHQPSKTVSRLISAVIALLIIVFGVIGYQFFPLTASTPLVVKSMQPLTSTDNRELASIYSPDGEYVIFMRYPEVLCTSHLWAKNLATQEEFQLTQDLGSYGSLAFADDGSKLAFVEQNSCGQAVTQKSCFQLQSLDFAKALKSPQTPTTLMECNNSKIRSLQWLNQDQVTLMQQLAHRWQLIRYSISSHSSDTIFSLEDGNLIDYDYSPSQNLIALTSIHHDDQRYIETLTPDGQLASSHLIDYPDSIPKFRNISANFSPRDNQLIFSTGKQLFTLSFKGQITPVSLPLVDGIGSPVFHPDGKRMLAIKGHYDSDIVAVPLSQFTDNPLSLDGSNFRHSVIARSTFGENHAKYQPNGDAIAYTSKRSGNWQMWLTQGSNTQQLSQFPLGSYIYDFVWGADGSSLLVNVSSELKQIDVNGGETSISLAQPLSKLFDWDSSKQTALAMVQIRGVERFAEINLATGDIHQLSDKRITWAAKSDTGQLIYMDHMDRFWRPDGAEDKLVSALELQGSDKRFIIKNNLVYGVNDDFQLWSYGLDDKQFRFIGQLPDTIDYITDLKKQTLLMTMRIAARKDVVELTLD
ncbi:winged helix-turn-helix domain-containing protein [Shewanella woodyi]|uniref:winged helix-turn-helix domain-containing protein n=1 Tax=Shewanella woodyi TaxID=60961 RepID=UPI0007F9723B|nr:transcriptional regulator [Shewanella woodyi]